MENLLEYIKKNRSSEYSNLSVYKNKNGTPIGIRLKEDDMDFIISLYELLDDYTFDDANQLHRMDPKYRDLELPSKEEFDKINEHFDEINQMLKSVHGHELSKDRLYWTCISAGRDYAYACMFGTKDRFPIIKRSVDLAVRLIKQCYDVD